jgi:hypothetical protein
MLLGFGGEFLLGTWVAAPLPAVGSVWASVRIQPTWWWCSSGCMMAAPLLAVGSVFSMWAVSVPLAPIQPTWVGFRRWWCSSSGCMMAAPLLAVGSVFSMWAVSVPLAPIQPTWVGFRIPVCVKVVHVGFYNICNRPYSLTFCPLPFVSSIYNPRKPGVEMVT